MVVVVVVCVCVFVCVCVCARTALAASVPPPLLPFLRRSARAEWLEWWEGWPCHGAVPPPSGAPAGRAGVGARKGGMGVAGLGAVSSVGSLYDCVVVSMSVSMNV